MIGLQPRAPEDSDKPESRRLYLGQAQADIPALGTLDESSNIT